MYPNVRTSRIVQSVFPVLVAVPVLLLGGCDSVDSLLDVEAPGLLPGDSFENPANASLLVSGAVGAFECALARYVVAGAAIGNELKDAQQTGGTGMWEMDRRRMPPQGVYATNTCNDNHPGVYVPLSTARWMADNVLRKLENEWTDQQVSNRTTLIATAAAHAGYSTLLLGEGMCSAALDLGPEMSKAQLFAYAETRFTRAIAAAEAASNPSILNMARVGRARARLNLGKLQEAAADARLVPENFVRNAQFSSASLRVENRVFAMINRDNQYTVEEVYRDLSFGGVADSRVAARSTGRRGLDGITAIWDQSKYASESAPIPIARWAEAQLIVAEAELGQVAVAIINRLHTRVGLPPFASIDDAEIRRQVIQERQRELFLEGHHLHDLTRYDLPLFPAPGTPYPLKGGTYGTDQCIPLPDVERNNNPNI
jgi:starch-binding outer membrane protein, SusD/RagB family